MPDAQLQPGVFGDAGKAARAAEAYRRGLMGPQTKARYEEWMRRKGAPLTPEQQLGREMTHLRSEPGGGDPTRLPGVDYETGLGFGAETAAKMADTPAEEKAALEKQFGAGKVGQDPGGRFYAETPKGKVAVAGGILPSIAAAGPQLVGGTVGAVAGGAAGGPMGAAVGAGVGAAAGKASQEWAKLLGGTQRKTLGQEASALGWEGLLGMAGQAVGDVLTRMIPKGVGKLFRGKIADVTPERAQMAAGIERAGGVAPIESVAPGLQSPVQKQYISRSLGYDPLAKRNRPVVQARLRELVESSKIGPLEREGAMREILDPGSAISSAKAGETVTQAVTAKVTQAEKDLAALSARRDQMLDRQLTSISARMQQPGALGTDVANALGAAREQFSRDMQMEYGPIRQMIGDTPVNPTSGIARQVAAVLDAMPKTDKGEPIFQDPKVIDSLRRLAQLPQKIRLGDAQEIRSILGSWALSPDLAGSLPKRQFSMLREAVDQSFNLAAQDPAVAPAINMLRAADAKYAAGIKKFENLAINRIAKDVRDGIVPDPTYVANEILKPEQLEQAQTIKRMMPPAVWERVAGAEWQNMLGAARDPQTGMVSSRKLAIEIKNLDRSKLLDLTFGGRSRDIRLYSERLAARDEKLPANQLGIDHFGQTMRILERRQGEFDRYLSENYLGALAKPGRDRDEAVKWIVQPGAESRLAQAEKEFGSASSIMQAIRTQWLKETLHKAITASETGVGSGVSGPAIETELRKYTPRQLAILAPSGLADDMRTLAKEIQAMFPKPTDSSISRGALVAGAIKASPLLGSPHAAKVGALTGAVLGGVPGFLAGPAGAMAGAGTMGTLGGLGGFFFGGRLARTAYYEAMAWIYSRPTTVRLLTQGLQPGPAKSATRETINLIFRAGARGMLPSVDETQWRDPAMGAPRQPPRPPPRHATERALPF